MSGRRADTVRGGRYLAMLAGASLLAAGCGTTVARTDTDTLAAAVAKAKADSGGSPQPPAVSGSLTPAQAAAAEQAVAAFWAALGRGDPAADQLVPPAQRSCVSSLLDSGPKITVSKLRIISAKPAGGGRAAVRFTVSAKASLAGQDLPLFAQGPGTVQWLVTTQIAGHWYVDLKASTGFPFAGFCP